MIRLAITILLFHLYLPCMSQGEPFAKRLVASGLNAAWEVIYGPHDSLWVTENKGYRIQRINIADGVKTLLADIKSSDPDIDLPASGTQAQGGLMGLALHPALFSSDAAVRAAKPWVYAVYVYKRNVCPGTMTACFFTTKIVRFTYLNDQLINPLTILDNIPGSSDHNSGRLLISAVAEDGGAAGSQYRLYYTLGDMGAGRDKNTTRTQNSLNTDALEGKVIRLNTEDDGDPGADAWIPNDNPFYDNASISPRDYIYSYGHRNAQGLAWGTIGSQHLLYSSEQMDKTDDEINIIKRGSNYGWDSVAGYCDGNVNGTRIGQTASADEQQYCSTHPDHTEPIFTMFTASAAQVAALPANDNSTWPTAALSSIDFYDHDQIPDWKYSLLVTALKKDFVYRLKLTSSGDAISGDTISYFRGDGNRIRRVTVAPDGIRFFVARDLDATANGGTIMEYSYSGAVLSIPDRPRPPASDDSGYIKVYPNPASNFIIVETPRTLQKPFVAELYRISGALVKRASFSSGKYSLDLTGLAAGIYVLNVSDRFGFSVIKKRIVKM